jgi:hypothetical protein
MSEKKRQKSADEETRNPLDICSSLSIKGNFLNCCYKAVTLADDTELYILPAMDELMMLVETCED